jgi:hypothetical protein
MKTASFNMTSSQFAFIAAVRPHLAAFGITAKNTSNGQSVSFSPLFRAAHKAALAGPRDRQKTIQDEELAPGKGSSLPETPS